MDKKGSIKGIFKSVFGKPLIRKKPSTKFEDFNLIKAIDGDYGLMGKRLYEDSTIALIFGRRGSGKTAFGFKLLENLYNKTGRKCYVIGIENKLTPRWIKSVDSISEAKRGGAVLVDEGALSFGSRESMSSKNKELTKILAVARHEDLTLFFITQNTGLIDKNVLTLVDTLFIKEGSLLQEEMERPEIKKFYQKSRGEFSKIKESKAGYVYILDSDFEGIVSFSLPSFWTDNLSKNRRRNI